MKKDSLLESLPVLIERFDLFQGEEQSTLVLSEVITH